MQISLEKPTTLARRMTVTLPEDRIANELQSRLDKLRRTARIDGFRQGKAPVSVVQRQFGRRLRDEIVGELMQSSFAQAMTQEALRPAGQPVIDSVSAEPGQGLSFTASFEVFPEIQLAPAEQLEITRLRCDIGETDIDAMIVKLREQNREWVTVERLSQDGDQLTIDFAGSIADEAFEGGQGESFDLILGRGSMIAGFEDGLRGRKSGEQVTLDLAFPADYRNNQVAGQPVRFEIVIHRVAEPVLPEINEAFIEKFGVKDGGLEAFRREVLDNMTRERERVLRQRFTSEVLEKASAANEIDLPASLVDSEAQRLRQQIARDLMMRGVNPADAAEQIEQTVRERALQRVKIGLVMAEIVKVAELHADSGRVRQMIEGMAGGYEDPSAVVKWYYENPQQLQQVEAMCLEEDAVNWIASRAKVTEASISFDGLMNPVQTGQKVEANT